MRKKAVIALMVLVATVSMFMLILKKDHQLSLGNVSKVHVMLKVDDSVLEKDFDTHLDEIDNMLEKLKIKKVNEDTRLGWELAITGYDENHEEKVRISFGGDHMSYNNEQYICESEEIKELINYFREEL